MSAATRSPIGDGSAKGPLTIGGVCELLGKEFPEIGRAHV